MHQNPKLFPVVSGFGRSFRCLFHRISLGIQRQFRIRHSLRHGIRLTGDDNVRALRHLRYQAEHDPVTGYSNFAKFKTDAAELLAARGDRKYSLWYCDIRNFKFINDIYGYDIGDELLSYWAELIAEGARPGETFGRISGTTLPCCGAIGISTIWWRGSCAVRIC